MLRAVILRASYKQGAFKELGVGVEGRGTRSQMLITPRSDSDLPEGQFTGPLTGGRGRE